MLDRCQGAQGGNFALLHEGRPGLQHAVGRPPPTPQSRPKPALCGGLVSHWDASPQDVPGRPCRRAPATATRMLNQVVFVKSPEVVLFGCFLLGDKTSREAMPSKFAPPECLEYGSWIDPRRTGWWRTVPGGFSGGATTPAGPPGVVGPVPGRPVLRSEIFPTPCRSDP